MPITYWFVIVLALVCIVLLVLSLLNHRGEHHYDNQESDGSCDPMDDKIDKYDDN